VILIGLGSNLPSTAGSPASTIEAALVRLRREGVQVVARSRFYRSEPVPKSDQPQFVNAVAQIETVLPPDDLLALLHRIEDAFGRVRRIRNEARPLDLDLLDYDGRIVAGGPNTPTLPHPRAHLRAFVLVPLQEIAPAWIHPVLKRTVAELLTGLPPEDLKAVVPLERAEGGDGAGNWR
jgi:2-amino-4-hydroxy-6-hydroxymethyldihydropteridine diphosphokinase